MSIELIAAWIADRAYELVRTDIIFGRLAPAARLRLDRLAQRYGASVSTLREIRAAFPRRASSWPKGNADSR